jgi:hypothetical protein
MMKHSILTVTIAVLFSASASAQSSETSASGSLKEKLAVARARADANARTVKRMVVSPSSLELSVGDSIISNDLFGRLSIVGLTERGDSVYDFAKTVAIQPNDYLEQNGSMLIAWRRGIATLWIYVGVDPNRRLFTEAEYAERVRITIK